MGESAVRDPTWLLGLSPGSARPPGCHVLRPWWDGLPPSEPVRRRRPYAHGVSPGIVLAVLIVAIGAQLTRLVAPGRGNYVVALVCAAVGLLGAELLALGGHGGPSLGTIHPLADAGGIAIAEVVGLVLAAPPRWGRR
jgi:hypothetical protein